MHSFTFIPDESSSVCSLTAEDCLNGLFLILGVGPLSLSPKFRRFTPPMNGKSFLNKKFEMKSGLINQWCSKAYSNHISTNQMFQARGQGRPGSSNHICTNQMFQARGQGRPGSSRTTTPRNKHPTNSNKPVTPPQRSNRSYPLTPSSLMSPSISMLRICGTSSTSSALR
jgi:hypothetical protein